jgi:hypothetical protein
MNNYNVDTTGWNSYPFQYEGLEFVSLISPESPLLKQINQLPAGLFEVMNQSAIKDLVGTNLTRDYVSEKLIELNENASHAILELVG